MTKRDNTPAVQRPALVVAVAVILGLLGYFAVPASRAADPNVLLAIGLFVGALVGGLVAVFGGSRPRAAREPVARSIAAPPGDEDKSVKAIFVGNLAFNASRDDLADLFAAYGKVQSVKIMTDRATRRRRGFAFVMMGPREADKAIAALDGREFFGRNLKVSEAKERRPQGDDVE